MTSLHHNLWDVIATFCIIAIYYEWGCLWCDFIRGSIRPSQEKQMFTIGKSIESYLLADFIEVVCVSQPLKVRI